MGKETEFVSSTEIVCDSEDIGPVPSNNEILKSWNLMFPELTEFFKKLTPIQTNTIFLYNDLCPDYSNRNPNSFVSLDLSKRGNLKCPFDEIYVNKVLNHLIHLDINGRGKTETSFVFVVILFFLMLKKWIDVDDEILSYNYFRHHYIHFAVAFMKHCDFIITGSNKSFDNHPNDYSDFIDIIPEFSEKALEIFNSFSDKQYQIDFFTNELIYGESVYQDFILRLYDITGKFSTEDFSEKMKIVHQMMLYIMRKNKDLFIFSEDFFDDENDNVIEPI